MTASKTEIVDHLINIPQLDRYNYNWGCHDYDRTFWNVDDDTYINGILLMIDMDIEHGSLLEIVERSTSVVSYLAVVELLPDYHDAEWYPNPVGTFFDRNVSQEQACAWAVGKIYGLRDSWYDRQQNTTDRILYALSKED